jgi:hypothetical protein
MISRPGPQARDDPLDGTCDGRPHHATITQAGSDAESFAVAVMRADGRHGRADGYKGTSMLS